MQYEHVYGLTIYYSGKNYSAFFVNQCPYCGVRVRPRFLDVVAISGNNKDYALYLMATFHVECCDKVILGTYFKNPEANNIELIHVHPSPKPEKLPDEIALISPRAESVYQQAQRALMNNDFELAGTGFRTFVEILAKDYLIDELGQERSKVEGMSLYNSLKALSDDSLIVSGDVVRVLGNDSTHYQKKYEHHDISMLIQYLNIFIQIMKAQYMVNHPPEDLTRQS